MTEKRPSDIWHEIEKEQIAVNKSKAHNFTDKHDDAREGISARREKFIKDLNTGSPKVLPANKKDNY